MKRLLKIAVQASFSSFVPILSYMLIGLIHNEPDFISGMSFTYPYQFLFQMIGAATITAQLKHENKVSKGDKEVVSPLLEQLNSRNASKTGIFIFMSLSISIAVVSFAFVGYIEKYFGMYAKVHRWSFYYGLSAMILDWVVQHYCSMLNYNKEETRAIKAVSVWYALKIAYIVATALPFLHFSYKTAVVFILVMQAFTLLCYIFRLGRPRKVSFHLIPAFKYSLKALAYNPFMALIYIVGIHGMGTTDMAILSAYNMMTMCTDTQWDVLSNAIDTDTTLHICDGNFENNKKRIFGNAFLFSSILVASSVCLMAISSTLFADINYKYAVVMLAIEMLALLIDGINCVMESYVGIMRPSAWIPVATIARYIVRFASQLAIRSTYNISVSVLISATVGFVFAGILYSKAKFKANKQRQE